MVRHRANSAGVAWKIAALSPVEGSSARESSDVRLYCDNDRRWAPDPVQPGIVQDRTNKMVSDSTLCNAVDPSGARRPIFARVYNSRARNANENPGRQSITLCDALISPSGVSPRWSFTHGNTNWPQAIQQSGMSIVGAVIAHTLYHEVTRPNPTPHNCSADISSYVTCLVS
jgi:hypothetical protein